MHARIRKHPAEGVSSAGCQYVARSRLAWPVGFRVVRDDHWVARLHHAAHAAHSTHAAHATAWHAATAALLAVLLLDVTDDHIGREQETGDGSRVLQGDSLDLGRDQDAHLDHVAELAGEDVVAEVRALLGHDALPDDRTVIAGVHGDLLEPLPGPVDFIVANLPYVKQSQLRADGFEPLLALDGGRDGLERIRQLCRQVSNRLRSGGCLLLEIGQGQEGAVTTLLNGFLPAAEIEVMPDLAGIDRVLTAVLPPVLKT